MSSAPFEQSSTFAIDNHNTLTPGHQVDPDTFGTDGHEETLAFAHPIYDAKQSHCLYSSIPSYRASPSNNPPCDDVGTLWPESMWATRFDPVFDRPTAPGYASPAWGGTQDPQGIQYNLSSSDPRIPTAVRDLHGPSSTLNSYEGNATLLNTREQNFLPFVPSDPSQFQPVMHNHETFRNSMYPTYGS